MQKDPNFVLHSVLCVAKTLSLIKSLHEISILDNVEVTVGSFFIFAFALDRSCNVFLWFLFLYNYLGKENHDLNLYNTDAIPKLQDSKYCFSFPLSFRIENSGFLFIVFGIPFCFLLASNFRISFELTITFV